MRVLVAVEGMGKLEKLRVEEAVSVIIGGRSVTFALIEMPAPAFSPAVDRKHVLVRVTGFSLNYRDLSFLPIWTDKRGNLLPGMGRHGIGSEFVGQVCGVGLDVEGLKVGDRVVAQMAWPSFNPDVRGGVPTNSASREVLKLHREQVVKVPEQMPDEVAAGFVLGAQTAYAMVRRLEMRTGEAVLVTAATSNTSLFGIQRLARMDVDIVALTTTPGATDRLDALGATRVIEVGGPHSLAPVSEYSQSVGGFNAVFDPFSNVYFTRVAPMMGFFSRYVSCGVSVPGIRHNEVGHRDWSISIRDLIPRNATVITSCLGLREDLDEALRDYVAGRLDVVLDSVHGPGTLASFVDRTWVDPGRYGRVVFLYA